MYIGLQKKCFPIVKDVHYVKIVTILLGKHSSFEMLQSVWVYLVFNELRWEVIVCFVYILWPSQFKLSFSNVKELYNLGNILSIPQGFKETTFRHYWWW